MIYCTVETSMTPVCEKTFSAEVRLVHAEQIFSHNFIVLRKNNRHSWRLKKSSKTFCLSKCKWDKNHMFLKIIFIYFLLLCKVLSTNFCLLKLATRLIFHWKAIFILSLLYLCSLLLLHEDIESNPGPRNSKYHLPSFCHWNLAYQHKTLQRCYF